MMVQEEFLRFKEFDPKKCIIDTMDVQLWQGKIVMWRKSENILFYCTSYRLNLVMNLNCVNEIHNIVSTIKHIRMLFEKSVLREKYIYMLVLF